MRGVSVWHHAGLSPPARGILARRSHDYRIAGSIPARAGYNLVAHSSLFSLKIYPRPARCITLTPSAPPRLCVQILPLQTEKPPSQRRLSQRPGRGLCLSRRKSTRPRCHPRFPPTFRFRRTLCPGGSPRAGDRDAPDNGERDRRSLLAPRAFGPKLWSDVRKRPAARSHHIGRR